MEYRFQKTPCPCLEMILRQNQDAEQTLELRLNDGMPDIGRVISAWGQPVLRSKEWRGDEVSFSGGMMVWVLYGPEDGSAPRTVEGWVPFRMAWSISPGERDGQIRLHCRPRFTDARRLSPRKLMVRCGMAAQAQALLPTQPDILSPEEPDGNLQLLWQSYPVRLMKEAGEKVFALDEELTLPPSAPQPEKLVYYTLNPEVMDTKVLTDRLVFRGNGNLHVLYLSEEGKLAAWDFPLAFSQFAELEGSYGSDAEADVEMMVTNLELNMDSEGMLRLKCGLAGQYLLNQPQMIRVVSDAYAPGYDLEITRDQLHLPVMLENRQENIPVRQQLPGPSGTAVDALFLPDLPKYRDMGEQGRMELNGVFQTLSYNEEDTLNAASTRWEGELPMGVHDHAQIGALPQNGTSVQMLSDGEGQALRCDVTMKLSTMGTTNIPVITGLSLGEKQSSDRQKPSLILRRAGQNSLWELAKASGSTVEEIQKANNLTAEPEPGQMLLIPVR